MKVCVSLRCPFCGIEREFKKENECFVCHQILAENLPASELVELQKMKMEYDLEKKAESEAEYRESLAKKEATKKIIETAATREIDPCPHGYQNLHQCPTCEETCPRDHYQELRDEEAMNEEI